MRRHERRHEVVDGPLRGGDGDAGLQPRDGGYGARRAEIGRAGGPDVDAFRNVGARPHVDAEASRHDADDHDIDVVDFDVAADQRRIAVPAALPKLVAHVHRAHVRIADVVTAVYLAAERGRRAEQGEQVVADRCRRNVLHVVDAGDADPRLVERADASEEIRSFAEREVFLGGEGGSVCHRRRVGPEGDEAISVAVGERLQEHRAHDTEDGRRHADAQRDHGQRRSGIRLVAHEDAPREADVLERVHRAPVLPIACRARIRTVNILRR